MQRFVKHIVIIISGTIALLPLLLSVFFLVKQARIKEQMEKKLEQQFLQTVRIPLHNLEWVKPGKEIKIGKELFDVKTYTVQNQVVVLTGLYDKKEKILHQQLEKLIHRQQDGKNENNAGSFLFSFTSCQNDFPSYLPPPFPSLIIFNLLPTASLMPVFIEPGTPPPNA
jgi:hypothetical protein